MPLHLRELPKGQRFVLIRTGDKFVYLGVGVSPCNGVFLGIIESDEEFAARAANAKSGVQPLD